MRAPGPASTGAHGAPAGVPSVVVPVRDGVRYLAEALDSVFGQVPRPAEVVVVDDGSGDGSGDLALDKGAVVVHLPGRGPAAARNAGVARATGSMVAFLDADDRMAPGRLALQGAALAEDPALDGVLGWVRTFDDAGRVGPAEPGWLPSALTVRREAFVASGGFAEDLAAGEFVDWVARCRAAGCRLAMLSSLVAERRAHDANLTRQHERLAAGFLEVARRGVARHRSGPPDP